MILDVLGVSLGFVLRAVAGAVAISVQHQRLAAHLHDPARAVPGPGQAAARAGDASATPPPTTARILAEYSPYLLDQMIAVVTASCLMAYAFYTTAPETLEKFQTDRLAWTIPFVLYGIFRYLYLVHQKEQGGSPTDVLLTDRPLLVAVALWAVSDRGHRLHGRRRAGAARPLSAAMAVEIQADGVDVEEVMRAIRAAHRREEGARLYTDDELREIAGHRLHPVLDAHEFRSGLLEELLADPTRWNYAFDPETIYRSSRGARGPASWSRRGAAAAGAEAVLEPGAHDLGPLPPGRPEPVARPPAAQPGPS